MEASFLTRHPRVRDVISFVGFVTVVLVGTLLINTFIFRSFIVSGHSMDDTLHDKDRLIVNRVPSTIASIQNRAYVPDRGEVIVFKNPKWSYGQEDEYIVKRVIAFPGERVVVENGVLTIYNAEYPAGFQPDDLWRHDDKGPKSPVSASEVDTTVPDGTIYVAGDNRIGNNSYDSRTGLGTIPTYDIIGPVSFRIWPLTGLGSV